MLERDYGLVPTHRGGLRLLYSSSPPICCALHFSTLNFWKIASGFKSSEKLFLYIGKAFMSWATLTFAQSCRLCKGSVCFKGSFWEPILQFLIIFKNCCKFVKAFKLDIKGPFFGRIVKIWGYFSHIYALFIYFCHNRHLQDFLEKSAKKFTI